MSAQNQPPPAAKTQSAATAQNAAQTYDLLIVGGGINGAGIARDAVGRGLRVLMCEQNDLAQHTSSASTKLIHGGLRYLEYYEFRLVRKALQEREVLLRAAPHIIAPLRFVMPHDANQRPAWLIRCGLFLYDHLARREFLPSSTGVRLGEHVAGKYLKGSYRRAFEFSDGWVDDARLVVMNALDAKERGARIMTRTKCVAAERYADAGGKAWKATLQSETEGRVEVTARAIVNAAGPWAAEFAGLASKTKNGYGLRLVKGSHIVVPRMFDHPYAYFFQNPDKRIIFAIPFQNDFTLIGTTDMEYTGDPGKVAINDDEVAYLCEMASRYFEKQIRREDVVWTYSGVRPLLDDASENASAITRDYLLECDDAGAPMLNVWGGKITTYRKLAEEAMALLLPRLGVSAPDWTDTAYLPGGDLEQAGELIQHYDFDAYLAKFRKQYPWLPAPLALRYARNYGSRAQTMLAGAGKLADLGTELTPGVYSREAKYLHDVEWARSAEDILWRRTKCGLYAKPEHVAKLQEWLTLSVANHAA